MNNTIKKLFSKIVALVTFGMSKRYGKEERESLWTPEPTHTHTHGKKRGRGYTKAHSVRNKRRTRRKPIVYGHKHGMPTLRVKCWGMV